MESGGSTRRCIWATSIAVFTLLSCSLRVESIADFASICPYTDFCTVNATLKVSPASTFEPCCQQCSCSSDCHKFGNCCLDIQNTKGFFPEYLCVNIDSFLNWPRYLYPQRKKSQYFYIVESCPDYDSEDRFPACVLPNYMEDFRIVSQDGLVYKNRDCALCHGVTDFKEWELISDCEDLLKLDFKTFDHRDNHVLLFCQLSSRPPADVSPCHHDLDTIDACPENDDSIDETVRQLCSKRKPYENTLVRKGSQIYSNYFCYLCNNPEEPNSGLCTKARENFVATETVAPEAVTFSAVIRNQRETKHLAETNKNCKESEIWDNYAAICRHLYCPRGMIAAHGRCVESFVYSEGWTFFILFEAFGETSDSLAFPMTDSNVQAVEEYVHGMLDPVFACGVCSPKLYQAHSSTFLELHLHTTKECSAASLRDVALTIIRKREEEGTILIVNDHDLEELNVNFKFTTERIPLVNRKQEYQLSLGRTCAYPAEQMDLKLLYDCPHVLIPLDESLGLNSDSNTLLDPVGLISVCVDADPTGSFTLQSNASFLYMDTYLVALPLLSLVFFHKKL